MTAPARNPDELAARISDGAELDPADWGGPGTPEQAALLAFGEVARAFRRVREADVQDAPTAPVQFRFGALEVERQVSEGRFARVYKAYDRSLGVPVALKLAPEGAAHGRDAQRFLAEARRLARLRHPNVVAVYGAAIHDGAAGFWTEWIEGESLEEHVQGRGPLPRDEALGLVRELGHALAFVHGHGLVHGDLKPGNAMRDTQGRAVLLDFGAAGTPEELARRVALAGTPQYLAPEVAAGRVPDAASDVYALGGVLIYLLGEERPGPDALSRLRARRPELDAPLFDLLARALEPDPARRFRDVPTFLGELELVRTPPPARRGRRALLAALLLGAAALAGWRLWPGGWETTLQFQRHGAAAVETLASGAALRVGDRIELALRSSQTTWAYVVNEDRAGVATLLFPLPDLDRRNPLAANADLVLPGTRGSVPQQWQVTSSGGEEHFLVILARAPLPEVEALLRDWQGARAVPDDTRAVQGLSLADSRGVAIEGARSRELAGALTRSADARRDLRLYQYRFVSE